MSVNNNVINSNRSQVDRTKLDFRKPYEAIDYINSLNIDDNKKSRMINIINYQYHRHKDEIDAQNNFFSKNPELKNKVLLKSAMDKGINLENINDFNDETLGRQYKSMLDRVYTNSDNLAFWIRNDDNLYNNIIDNLGGVNKALNDGYKFTTDSDGHKVIYLPREYSNLNKKFIDAVNNSKSEKSNILGMRRRWGNYVDDKKRVMSGNPYTEPSFRESLGTQAAAVVNFYNKLESDINESSSLTKQYLTDVQVFPGNNPYQTDLMGRRNEAIANGDEKALDFYNKAIKAQNDTYKNLSSADIEFNESEIFKKDEDGIYRKLTTADKIKLKKQFDNREKDISINTVYDSSNNTLFPQITFYFKNDDDNKEKITFMGNVIKGDYYDIYNQNKNLISQGDVDKSIFLNNNITIGYNLDNHFQLQPYNDNFRLLVNDEPIDMFCNREQAILLRENYNDICNASKYFKNVIQSGGNIAEELEYFVDINSKTLMDDFNSIFGKNFMNKEKAELMIRNILNL